MDSGLYGIIRSNRSRDRLWARECFPSSFAVALANYMCDRGVPANYVSVDEALGCRVSSIPVRTLYGTGRLPLGELTFDFDTVPEPVLGIPSFPTDLVIRDPRGNPLSRMEIMVSVVPDASTRSADHDMMGPEMTLRPDTLARCASSMAGGLRLRSEEVLELLGPACSGIRDWSSWDDVSPRLEDIVRALNEIERRFPNLQLPLLMQAVWRTEGASPVLSREALDLFVWSDFALTRLFLDRDAAVRGDSPGRPQRCVLRTARLLMGILGPDPSDSGHLMDSMDYGIPGDRELMVNGRCVNRYIRSERLSHPAVTSKELTSMTSPGSESRIAPERRLDSTLYYAMTSPRV